MGESALHICNSVCEFTVKKRNIVLAGYNFTKLLLIVSRSISSNTQWQLWCFVLPMSFIIFLVLIYNTHMSPYLCNIIQVIIHHRVASHTKDCIVIWLERIKTTSTENINFTPMNRDSFILLWFGRFHVISFRKCNHIIQEYPSQTWTSGRYVSDGNSLNSILTFFLRIRSGLVKGFYPIKCNTPGELYTWPALFCVWMV